jgi:hypothetical protein
MVLKNSFSMNLFYSKYTRKFAVIYKFEKDNKC